MVEGQQPGSPGSPGTGAQLACTSSYPHALTPAGSPHLDGQEVEVAFLVRLLQDVLLNRVLAAGQARDSNREEWQGQ